MCLGNCLATFWWTAQTGTTWKRKGRSLSGPAGGKLFTRLKRHFTDWHHIHAFAGVLRWAFAAQPLRKIRNTRHKEQHEAERQRRPNYNVAHGNSWPDL